MCRLFSFFLLFVLSISQILLAHEEGAPFSGAIIEPILTHHAHIEDEQKINLEFVDRERVEIKDEEREFDVFRQELELAWASPDFRFGGELKLPFSNQGEDDGKRQYGPGDLEVWFPKYAWVNQPEQILTSLFAIHIPTGSESQGLGDGKTFLEGKVFFDRAYRNWFLGLNLESSTAVSGEFETKLEYSAVLSHSFIRGTQRAALIKPNQFLVIAPLFEVTGEAGISGETRGKAPVEMLGGLYFWHPKSGWSFRIGYRFPVGRDQEEEQALLVQFGNHFSWSRR
ncbi:MAG: hypothetical protein HY351_01070 [Candidatus Omnitrophica bacterium]|nr:hypothetical protein [Candidatus Omnitrophota bacterium]